MKRLTAEAVAGMAAGLEVFFAGSVYQDGG